MFFVGSLSSILPYLTTIIVMCVCMLLGQPTTISFSDDFASSKTGTSIESPENQQLSILDPTCNFEHSLQKSTPNITFPVCTNEPDTDFPCFCSSYRGLNHVANGNKAPPSYI